MSCVVIGKWVCHQCILRATAENELRLCSLKPVRVERDHEQRALLVHKSTERLA